MFETKVKQLEYIFRKETMFLSIEGELERVEVDEVEDHLKHIEGLWIGELDMYGTVLIAKNYFHG